MNVGLLINFHLILGLQIIAKDQLHLRRNFQKVSKVVFPKNTRFAKKRSSYQHVACFVLLSSKIHSGSP